MLSIKRSIWNMIEKIEIIDTTHLYRKMSFMEIIKANIDLSNMFFGMKYEFEYKGNQFKFLLAEDYPEYVSAKLGITGNGIMACVINGKEGFPIIILNRKNDPNDQMIQAVLAHEIGHIVNNHHKQSPIKRLLNHVNNEIEADNFAVSKGYGKEMLQFLKSCKEVKIPYLTKRISNLEKQIG